MHRTDIRKLPIKPEQESSRARRSHCASANDAEETDNHVQSRAVSVELDADDFKALKRVLAALADEHPVSESATADDAKCIAEIMFEMRNSRARLFPASMFNEPAWDMLLALFVAHEAPAAADLARWTSTPVSTAMRWIEYLETHKLIIREFRTEDRRAHRIRLTDEAREIMQSLFSEVARKLP